MLIRVVLVDDHAIVRTGLKAVIGATPGMTVVGEADGGNAAVELLSHTPADVVVMDLSMADGDGITATRAITRDGGCGARVLVLTMHAEESYLEPVLAAGASGYLVKSTADRELVEAVRAVARGETYVRPAAARALAQGARRRDELTAERERFERLTDREREILTILASHNGDNVPRETISGQGGPGSVANERTVDGESTPPDEGSTPPERRAAPPAGESYNDLA